MVSADRPPDHDTIAESRKRHWQAPAALFVQVLQLCREAGRVKLGHVALDGTKVRANASKHKAMSYDRMKEKEKELEAEVERLLALAEQVDAEEDALHGKGKRGDELPKELRFRQTRLAKIRQAKRALEERARAERDEEEKRREASGEKHKGPAPKEVPDTPSPKAQYNFTDPESRIMKDGATKSFEQSYNCPAVVDPYAQIIVATHVTQEANDKQQGVPLVEKMKENLAGDKPDELSADNGYFSEDNVTDLEAEEIEPFLATGRQNHGEHVLSPRGRIPQNATVKERMARKLRTLRGRGACKKRKQTVEPVFGQIKDARGFWQFLLRLLAKSAAEWDLICLTHNLLKLHRSRWKVQTA